MVDFWSLGGLPVIELIRRTARESWQDSVFGQGGLMAFYQFLAIFPSLLVLLALAARVPHAGASVKVSLQDLSEQVLPLQGARLFASIMNELSGRAASDLHFVAVCAGALWAACNATRGMITGLNRAYEVEERRSWGQMGITIGGLTLSLGVTTCCALFLIFGGAEVEAHLRADSVVFRSAEILVVVFFFSLSLALLYRFAPNLRDPEWRWSTPGTLCAVVLCAGATVAARVYFGLVDYSRTYGHLNGVVMLLLWLYVMNGAILIGGEMNSEIQKATRAK